jgi:hypothetical protein
MAQPTVKKVQPMIKKVRATKMNKQPPRQKARATSQTGLLEHFAMALIAP